MSKYLKALAEKVDIYMTNKNLSAREFADLCGISNSSVSSFIKKPSETDLRFSTIEAMAKAIGLTPIDALTNSSLQEPDKIPIEARVAALESRVFSTPSSLEHEEERPTVEEVVGAVVAEVDAEFAPPPKKNARKTGTE